MFSHEDFALSMQEQSYVLVPDEFSEKEKRFLATKLYEFSFLVGESLNKDTQKNLTDDEKEMFVQVIAEWTFHKTVDLIKAEVPEEYRNDILHCIAHRIYDVLAEEMSRNISHDQLLVIVESHVVQVYKECINKLPLDNKHKKKAICQSNIDEYSKKNNPPDSLKQKYFYWLIAITYTCLVVLSTFLCINYIINNNNPFIVVTVLILQYLIIKIFNPAN